MTKENQQSNNSAPGDAQDERQAFEAWLYLDQTQRDPDDMNKAEIDLAREAFSAGLRKAAPAAGDALDAKRYRWLRDQTETDGIAIVMKNKHFDASRTCAENIDKLIDAALAAQVPQQGEA